LLSVKHFLNISNFLEYKLKLVLSSKIPKNDASAPTLTSSWVNTSTQPSTLADVESLARFSCGNPTLEVACSLEPVSERVSVLEGEAVSAEKSVLEGTGIDSKSLVVAASLSPAALDGNAGTVFKAAVEVCSAKCFPRTVDVSPLATALRVSSAVELASRLTKTPAPVPKILRAKFKLGIRWAETEALDATEGAT
jgi:hypothetical protein